MTPKNTRQFLFSGYTFEQEQQFKKIREHLSNVCYHCEICLSHKVPDVNQCSGPCGICQCDICTSSQAYRKIKSHDLTQQYTDKYLQKAIKKAHDVAQLQAKSDQADPVQVPQYERD